MLNDMDMISDKDIDRLEEERISKLEDAGIDEGDVLTAAKQDFNAWNSYFDENIQRGREDLNFCVKDQWDSEQRQQLRNAMTFNKLYDSIKKIIAEQRKNKPDLLVRSLNGRATQEEIDLRADIIRSICYHSQNELVYQTAFRSALTTGFGAYQIDIDYDHHKSFQKVIRYLTIPDATRTAFDPNAMKPHKGDGNFCARTYLLSLDEFAATYPHIQNPVSYSNPMMNLGNDWGVTNKEGIVVADRFVKEWFPVKIYKLSNGQVVTDDEWKKMQKEFKFKKELAQSSMEVGSLIMDEIPRIVAERMAQDYNIMHYRMTHNQILEFRKWPSRHLPIIFVDGDSQYLEGRQYTNSFIHRAKDAQRSLNYFNSEIVSEVRNRRREQWLVTPDNIAGQTEMWTNPQLQQGALIAKPDPKTGQMPQKLPPFELSQTLMAQSARCTQEIREIMGYSEAEVGQSRDISGVAKRERKIEASMSAYVYFDNLNQAIEQGGRVVLDLLPELFGEEERWMNVTKRDGTSDGILINQRNSDGTQSNQILRGEFDIEIDTGPSFAVQKETSIEFLTQLIGTNPQTILPLVADLYAKNLDVQFMPQLVERLQTIVPPAILAKEKGQPAPQQQPNPQAMMMQQEMQMKAQEMKMKQADLQLKSQQQQMSQTKLQLDAKKMYSDLISNQQDQSVEKAKLMVELKRIMADSESAEKDRALDLHKAHLDHQHKMYSVMNTQNTSQ